MKTQILNNIKQPVSIIVRALIVLSLLLNFNQLSTSAASLELIFTDSFETSNTDKWNRVVGPIKVSKISAMKGSFGVEVPVVSLSPTYLKDTTPNRESHYRAWFYIDVSRLTMSEGAKFRFFQGMLGKKQPFYLLLNKKNGKYRFRGVIKTNNGSRKMTPWAALPSSPSKIIISWKSADSPELKNGYLKLGVNGKLIYNRMRVGNNTLKIDNVRFGVTAKINSSFSVSGKFFLDGFISKKVAGTGGIPDLRSCERPYIPKSIWNQPINWSNAKIHSDSAAMIGEFLDSRGYVGANVDSYAPNIYFATNNTPLVSVKLYSNRFRDAIDDFKIIYGEPGGVVMMPIPKGALPSPGTDGQLAVINLDTGEEWGLRQGSIDSEGRWFASGAYRYHIGNSGVPPAGFGMRGAGIGQLAGIIRPCEITRGSINHAVTLAYDYPCSPKTCAANNWPASIYPFTDTDGRGTNRFDIPEGARIVIRPEITRKQIKQVCNGVKGCIVWAVNMQQYGGFIVDRSGGAKTYAEGDLSAQWDPAIWGNRMLKDIPHSWYAVLAWNNN